MSTKEIIFKQENKDFPFFAKVLNGLGIPKGYIGYIYLIEIINLIINEKSNVSSFSKNIYPVVANKYNKTMCTIERNIRFLIQKSMPTINLQKLPNLTKKPTCQKFIFTIVEYVLNRLK